MSLPSYIGVIISHYKDPYQLTSIMECQQGFERCSTVDSGERTCCKLSNTTARRLDMHTAIT